MHWVCYRGSQRRNSACRYIAVRRYPALTRSAAAYTAWEDEQGMSLLNKFRGRTQPQTPAPEPEPEPPTDTRSRLLALTRLPIERLPYMPQMRLFWRDLNEMRNAWWFLLPLLAWVGWRTYRNERRDLRWQQATSRR
jgi:hypothetical protein